MTPRGAGPPNDRAGCWDHKHGFAVWDAAYVLGALSAGDRREFEAHMADCPSCRNAVAELSGMPAQLSQLDHDELTAIDAQIKQADHSGGAPPPGEPTPLLLAWVRRRRRRTRLATWASAVAATAVLAVGVFIGVEDRSLTLAPTPPRVTVSALLMTQVATNTLISTVSLRSERWGTFIALNCVCLALPNAHHDALAMVVVGRNGRRTQLATWVAHPGQTATPTASTSTRTDQIAAVQVVSVDDGRVLLQRSL
ncbi:MAG TPA: zf-HC2 domain-containing protein [Mycobacterium sp.]|nr:zf-HC2 domain-containing protein [Mycobacterium sp.]